MLRLTTGLSSIPLLCSAATAQSIFVTVPPPGTQTAISSADVEGIVVAVPGPQTAFEVFFRTRYPGGGTVPPINSQGAYEPGVLGWSYPVTD